MLSEAVAHSSLVTPGQMTEYSIGVINPTGQPQRVRLDLVFSRLSWHPQPNELCRFAANVDLPPRAMQRILVRYDWVGESRIMTNGSEIPAEEFQQTAAPQTTVYRLQIQLSDPSRHSLDTCELFQRVVEAS